jgi:uncharacterized protein YecE (DUF72 family)
MSNNILHSRTSTSQFQFRDLHPKIFIGTASDRYAGWMDQIYTRERFEARISKRSKKVGGKSFQEKTLPIESVQEYFQHFSVLEIDFTFYSPLLNKDGQPSKNFNVLKTYASHISDNDRVILKVPQVISAQKVRYGNKYVNNETYLNPALFIKRFYEPANAILGSSLAGMIFEQEYQRKNERKPIQEMAAELDRFFKSIPQDTRYHIELRTEAYLNAAVFNVLDIHGIGQVLSHWTWLPSLKKQLDKANGKVFNSENQRIVRLMTPRGMRYENAYARAHPFDQLVDGMLSEEMIQDTVDIMRNGIDEGIQIHVLINNRAGGNAPLIAERISQSFF